MSNKMEVNTKKETKWVSIPYYLLALEASMRTPNRIEPALLLRQAEHDPVSPLVHVYYHIM